MLGLGTSLYTQSFVEGIRPQAAIFAVAITDADDETTLYQMVINDSASVAAIIDGKTLGTGNLMNGTVELTVTNTTADPDKTGVRTFNIFQFNNGSTIFYFLSGATSNITVSDAALGGEYYAVDLTTDGTDSDAFLTAGGANANLDASGAGEEYSFSAVLKIDGFQDSSALVSATSIDAA